MSYRVVEQRPDQHERAYEVGGRTYPVPSIVEDDDGLRLLLHHQYWLPVDLWVWAATSGAMAIVNVEGGKFVLSSLFEEERSENERMRSLVLAENRWDTYRPGMPYVEMAGVQDPGEAEVLAREGVGDEPEPDLGTFVHLHTHSEFSALDGVSKLGDMMKVITADGQKALAITDHGVCAGHPALQLAADAAGVQPIFGMEANFVPDRHVKGAEVRREYQHLVLWAMDDQGLRNLWAMSTAGFQEEAFYDRPRIDWEILERYHEGVMCSTACLRGPLMEPFLKGDFDAAEGNLLRLKGIFGDRLYIELHANQLDEQKRANHFAALLADAYEVPVVAVVDSHYDGPGCDAHEHRVWLSVQTNTDVADDTGMFGGGQEYHLMSEAEVRANLGYLDEEYPGIVDRSIATTVAVARRCTAKIETVSHKPIFSRPTAEWPDPLAHDVDRLMEMCLARWDERIPNRNLDEYVERFEREMELLISKQFCGYFLMVSDFVNWAKDHSILVGPGRGSGGGSLVAYLCRITEIDPVEHELLFERFMTEGREALPDFDIDFPSSKKQMMFDYVRERWGQENVAIVGTHMRMKSKGVLNDVARVLKSQLPEQAFLDFKKVAALIDDAEASTAGLGLPWDELWAQHEEELAPYRESYPEVFRLADVLYGRLKTYGTHPAGVLISTDGPITDSLPLRRGGEGAPMVTQFDMVAVEALGYAKFDLLNIRTLDTLQRTMDLIEETTGERVDVYGWTHDEEYADPIVFDEIGAGWTLGIFQIETQSGTRMTKRFEPRSVRELADVITLVRPGPMRSGLTETYFRRRAGEEETEVPDPRLEPVLAKTWGCMLYQEDIMQTCMVLGGYNSNEADEVRKILGKKKVEKVVAAGVQFIERAVGNGTDPLVAKLLWEQMAEFAKYSFNRAHAFSYAILGMWTAWFKFHYPVQFLCAALSTVKQERIADFVEEARRLGYKILPPDINESREGFTASAMAVRYGFLSIKGLGEVATEALLANQPFASWEDFLERKTSKVNSGVVKLLVKIGAFDSLVPNRRWLEKLIEAEEVKGSDRCSWKIDAPVLISGPMIKKKIDGVATEVLDQRELPCSYDWPSEPREPSKQAGRFKAPKPLPAKCSRACRQYVAIPPPTEDSVEPYTDEDIRQIEIETLGVFLSSTPFDRLSPEDRADASTAVEVLAAPPGNYLVIGMVRSFRPHDDRAGRPMGFLRVTTEQGELDLTVFSATRLAYEQYFEPGRLVAMSIYKDSRGQKLDELVDLDA